MRLLRCAAPAVSGTVLALFLATACAFQLPTNWDSVLQTTDAAGVPPTDSSGSRGSAGSGTARPDASHVQSGDVKPTPSSTDSSRRDLNAAISASSQAELDRTSNLTEVVVPGRPGQHSQGASAALLAEGAEVVANEKAVAEAPRTATGASTAKVQAHASADEADSHASLESEAQTGGDREDDPTVLLQTSVEAIGSPVYQYQSKSSHRHDSHHSNASDGANATSSQNLGRYGVRSMDALTEWWEEAKPWGDGPKMMKVLFFVVIAIQVCGPFLIYDVISVFVFSKADSTTKMEIVDLLRNPCKIMCFFTSTLLALYTLMGGNSQPYPFMKPVLQVLYAIISWAVAMVPIRLMQKADYVLEQYTMDRISNTDYLERRDFINMMRFGSNIVGPTDAKEDHGYFLFSYIWRPFYWSTLFIIALTALILATGSEFEGVPFALGLGYLATSMLLATFGVRTMGPQLYGSIYLFMEQPFKEGDLITLDPKAGGGGASTDVQKSIVTGFVERIGIVTTMVRRFDMRCVWVPNNMFSESAVANWSTRPRKLIQLQFSISHRTPPEACKLFQESVLQLVKNHEKVDQKMYLKCAINKMSQGLSVQVVCYNDHGTRKKEVQQDLILKIVALARRTDVKITFDQQNVYVEREDVSQNGLYLEDVDVASYNADVLKLRDIIPPKKARPSGPQRWFAPKNQLILRIGSVHLSLSSPGEGSTRNSAMVHGLTDDDNDSDRQDVKFYDRVLQERPYRLMVHTTQPKALAQSTGIAHVLDDDEEESLRFFENLAFPLTTEELPPVILIDLIQIDRGDETEVCIGSASVDVNDVVLETEATLLPLFDTARKEIGVVDVNIFVPEGFALSRGWECKKTLRQRPSTVDMGATADAASVALSSKTQKSFS